MRTPSLLAALVASAVLAGCSKPEPAAGAPTPDVVMVDSAKTDSTTTADSTTTIRHELPRTRLLIGGEHRNRVALIGPHLLNRSVHVTPHPISELAARHAALRAPEAAVDD